MSVFIAMDCSVRLVQPADVAVGRHTTTEMDVGMFAWQAHSPAATSRAENRVSWAIANYPTNPAGDDG
ncbi:MAG: hypothetical protein K1X90_06785 [Candidatus Kapabacteria bacterium]|nr:hypothetical protein [Candidatus Kapabacteria bacterium]